MQANNEQAWWLPRGSIRALLALAVVIPTMAVLAVNGEFGMMLSIAVIVLNFYFLKDAINGLTRSDEVRVSQPVDPVPNVLAGQRPVNGEPT